MTTPETICRLAETLKDLKYEKDREFVKDTINLLKKFLDREDELNQLKETVKELANKMDTEFSFLKNRPV